MRLYPRQASNRRGGIRFVASNPWWRFTRGDAFNAFSVKAWKWAKWNFMRRFIGWCRFFQRSVEKRGSLLKVARRR